MPKKTDDSAETIDQEFAHAILGKFLGNDAPAVLALFDQIPDPVVSAAVAIRVCYELDANQTAAFLAMLEDESLDDGEPDGEAEGAEADGG